MRLIAVVSVCFCIFLSACDSLVEKKETDLKTGAEAAKEIAAPESKGKEEVVLARVEGWELTEDEFNKVLSDLESSGASEGMDLSDQNTKEMLLQRMVNTEILYHAGLKRGFDKNDKIAGASSKAKRVLVIQAVLDDLSSNIEVSQEEIEEFYKNSGLTDKPISEVRENIIKAIELAKLEEEVAKLADSYRKVLRVEVNLRELRSGQ